MNGCYAFLALLLAPAVSAGVVELPAASRSNAPAIPLVVPAASAGGALPSLSPSLGLAPLLAPSAPSAPENPAGTPPGAAAPNRTEAPKLLAFMRRAQALLVADQLAPEAAQPGRKFPTGSYLVKARGETLLAVTPAMASAARD